MGERRKIRLVGIVLGALIALCLGLVGALHLPPTLSALRDVVTNVAEESLRGELEIDEMTGSPFTQLVLHDVTLTSRDGERLLAVERITVEADLGALLSSVVALDIGLHRASVFARRGRDGELNIIQVLPEPSEESSSDLPVALDLRITMADSAVVWRDDSAEATTDPLAELTPDSGTEAVASAAASVSQSELVTRAAPHTVALSEVETSLRVRVQPDIAVGIELKSLEANVTSVGVTKPRALSVGGVALTTMPSGDVTAVVDSVILADWLNLTGLYVRLPAAGLGDLTAGVGRLDVKRDLFERAAPEAGLRTDLELSLAAEPAEDGATQLWMKLLPVGHSPVELAVRLKDWAADPSAAAWTAALVAERVEASKIAAAAFPVQTASAWLTAEGRGFDPETMSATVKLRAADVLVDRYQLTSAYVEANYSDGALKVDRAEVRTPYANAEFDLAWSPDGRFETQLTARSSDEVKTLAETLFKRPVDTKADIELHAKGRLDLASEDALAMIPELNAKLHWDVQEFVAEDTRVDRSSGRMTAEVSSEGGRTQVNVDLDGKAHTVRAGGASLGSLNIDASARSTVDTQTPTVMAVLKKLTGRVDLDIGGLAAPGVVARRVDMLASVRPRGGRLRYDVKGSAGSVAASALRVSDAALDLKGDVLLGRTLDWPAAISELSVKGGASARGLKSEANSVGAINATLDVAGSLDDLKGDVRAQTEGLTLGEYAFETLGATVSFVGDRLFEIDGEGTQKDRSPAQVGVFAKGRYNRALTDFELLELRFRTIGDDWELTDGFSFDTKSGTARFDDVTLTHKDQRINVKGVFTQGKGQDLTATVERLDLQDLAAEFGVAGMEQLRGRVSAQAEVGGTASEPTARFNIHLEDLYWDEFGPFELVAEGRYEQLALVVESFAVDGYDIRLAEGNATLPLRITTDGDFEVLADGPLATFVETPRFASNKLEAVHPKIAAWELGGELAVTANLHGTINDPSLVFEAKTFAFGATGAWNEESVEIGPVNSTMSVRYRNPRVSGGGAEVSLNAAWGDEPPLKLYGKVRADVAKWVREAMSDEEVNWDLRMKRTPWRLLAKAERFDLRNLRVGRLREADVAGFVTLDVTGDGTLYNPQAKFDVKLEGFGWNRYRDVFLDAKVEVDTDKIRLESARLEWDADEILTASGTIPAPFQAIFGDAPIGDLPIDFQTRLTPMKLAKLSAIDYSLASLKGEVAGFASFGGTLTAPIAEGQLAVTSMQFSDRSMGGASIDLAFTKQQQARARVRFTREQRQTLVATANAPLKLNLVRLLAGEELAPPTEFSASIQADAAPVAALIPRKIFDSTIRDIGGSFSSDLKVSGPLDGPTFEGRVQLDDAEFVLTQFSRGFKEIRLDLVADPQGNIALHDLHISEEQGYLDAQGKLGLSGWKLGDVDGKLEMREFGTTGFIDQGMFISADVALDGDFSAVPATATATISELEVVLPDNSSATTHSTTLDKDIVIIRNERDREALFALQSSIEPVSSAPFAELAIKIERDSWVRHPLAVVELEGDLSLQLSPAGPSITGEIQTVRGSAEVLNKRFEIEEALVTFTGQDPPDPRLQIEAAYELDRSITAALGQATSGKPRAIVRVTGRVSDPRIRFLSDPAMSESDVIYVLMTNRPPGEGEVGETGLAAGAVSGIATGLIQDSVGDVVDVRVEAGDGGLADASIEVGKYIFTDVFVSLESKLSPEADENSTEFNIQYRFAPRWIFEFEAGNLGTGEANIFWDIY